jgi:succinate dehydrogenase / fumarate reductase iron-sulfur subunit
MPEPYNAKMSVWRGDANGGRFVDYEVPIEEGMVVLDTIHWIQANKDPDVAVRWNCKAAKCGSCSAEVNGRPSLMCKTRMEGFPKDSVVTVQPIQTFPIIKDLVTDVSWNYEQNKRIQPFTEKKDADWVIYQEDVDRVQEFRKCIECFLCQDVCHVLRDYNRKDAFSGPRFMIRVASLEMHPMDGGDRLKFLHEDGGIGMCNITKCCTEVCPEDIHITDNGIIPMKERVVDEYYDPVAKFLKRVFPVK